MKIIKQHIRLPSAGRRIVRGYDLNERVMPILFSIIQILRYVQNRRYPGGIWGIIKYVHEIIRMQSALEKVTEPYCYHYFRNTFGTLL
ncbi:hypothetical protein [Methanogenium sp. MK-MG]|uniref:hypothetical protein n=1 Tax=Methanogenium sp. MK-MG TaxID=2599926 RepID=UPI0013EA3C0A|nr:hypothetical protein [Methanogenium sp. MK-MG]KAF1075954.1 hypothetical protein MKMG_01616 [Methanogenium sp. MK-MG]